MIRLHLARDHPQHRARGVISMPISFSAASAKRRCSHRRQISVRSVSGRLIFFGCNAGTPQLLRSPVEIARGGGSPHHGLAVELDHDRSTPWVAGCWGPMLISMCSPARSGSGGARIGRAPSCATPSGNADRLTPSVQAGSRELELDGALLIRSWGACRAHRDAAVPSCRRGARRTPRRSTAPPWSSALRGWRPSAGAPARRG